MAVEGCFDEEKCSWRGCGGVFVDFSFGGDRSFAALRMTGEAQDDRDARSGRA